MENKDSLIKRYISGFYTKKDLEKIPDLFNSKNREETLHELDKLWNEAETNETIHEDYIHLKQDAKKLLRKLEEAEKKPAYHLPFRSLKYVAFIALAIALTFTIYQISGDVFSETAVYSTIDVMNGTHKKLTLSDGTYVLMNAGTKILVPDKFIGKERRVYLDGEAYFEVNPGESMPFIIETDELTIQVLGTKFNVKAYKEDDQYNVCVESGKVQVDMSDAMIRLTKDEQIVVDKINKEFKKEKESAARVLNWRQGGLYFNNTPLRSIANEIYRMYNQKIFLDESVDKTMGIYGEHDNTSLESLLKSICYATGLKYKHEYEQITIYKP